jgi:hypothetical protein
MDERVIDGFLKTTPITKEQQANYMSSNSQHYRIALVNRKPAGYVGVLNDDIRVCTHPDFQGLGVAKFMINECMNIWPTAYAKVKHGNEASSKLFLSCGFEMSGTDDKFLYYRKEKMETSLDSIYDELQGPILLSVLYVSKLENDTVDLVSVILQNLVIIVTITIIIIIIIIILYEVAFWPLSLTSFEEEPYNKNY